MQNLSRACSRNIVSVLIALLVALVLPGCEDALDDTSVSANTPGVQVINAVAGDQSWQPSIEQPSIGVSAQQAGEDERIAAHLVWVEAKLRRADTAHLSVEQRQRRAHLLDELNDYRKARAFPRHSSWSEPGLRRPRFVDDEGRHCAVAHLVAASGRADLVSAVQRDHELDFIADMDVPALAGWATKHGFSIRELELIQPTYRRADGSRYGPGVEMRRRRMEERRRRRAARKIRVLFSRSAQRQMAHACIEDAAGSWEFKTRLRVKRRNQRSDIIVRVRALPDGTRDEELEDCFRAELREGMRKVYKKIQFPPDEYRFHETHIQTIHVARPQDIEAEFFERRHLLRDVLTTWSWYVEDSIAALAQEQATAACVEHVPQDALPLRVPLVVDGDRFGKVFLRWADVPASEPGSMSSWRCIQDAIGRDELSQYGLADHPFDVEVQRDGTIRPAG